MSLLDLLVNNSDITRKVLTEADVLSAVDR